MRAAELLEVPVVYMTTMDRDFMREVMAEAAQQAAEAAAAGDEGVVVQPPEEASENVESMGEPATRITTEIEVRGYVDRKRAAMAAHGSQIDESSFFLAMPADAFSRVWGQEWFIRIQPAWSYTTETQRQGALTLEIDAVPA